MIQMNSTISTVEEQRLAIYSNVERMKNAVHVKKPVCVKMVSIVTKTVNAF